MPYFRQINETNSLLIASEMWWLDPSFTTAWLTLVPAFHQRVTGLGGCCLKDTFSRGPTKAVFTS